MSQNTNMSLFAFQSVKDIAYTWPNLKSRSEISKEILYL